MPARAEYRIEFYLRSYIKYSIDRKKGEAVLPIKVLHTSDWHLGAMLHNEDRKDEHRQFLSWLLSIIKKEKIDVLVVAGDIFDVYAPSSAAQKLYYDFLAGLIRQENGPEVFIVAGNHDSQHFLDAPADILSKLKIHVVSAADIEKPENLIFEVKSKTGEAVIVICAIPFLREKDIKAAVTASGGADSLAERYNEAAAAFYHKAYDIAKAKNIPVLMTGHFYLDGGKKSDDYSERTREVGNLRGLSAAMLPDADYYALGHLHNSQAVGGKDHIRYSGSPLQMSFSEAETAKFVVIAEFAADSAGTKPSIRLESVPVWQKLRQISGAPDTILRALRGIKARGEKVWLAVNVTECEGVLFDFWNTLEKEMEAEMPLLPQITFDPSCKILVRQDMRNCQSEGDWRDSDESADLLSLDPASVFQKFLLEEKITAEDSVIFMNMFNELYNDVIVNENGAETE
jgi:exonuclease SbcD